jgi:colanic acid biosynthesis protein WcaH
MNCIPVDKYVKIIELVPILCVDVIVRNLKNEYLLVKRANEPLKGHWWVIGGRVLKGETMEQAAIRKVKEEVSLDIKDLELLGYYEETFRENPFGTNGGIHTVSIVFTTVVDHNQSVELDSQSTDWKYSKQLPPNFLIKSFDGSDPFSLLQKSSDLPGKRQLSE